MATSARSLCTGNALLDSGVLRARASDYPPHRSPHLPINSAPRGCSLQSTFLKIGGYSEDRGIGYEDWEIYSRAALKVPARLAALTVTMILSRSWMKWCSVGDSVVAWLTPAARCRLRCLQGYNLMVVVHSLYWYRFTGGSMQKTTSYSRSRQRALRAYLEALAEQQEKALAGQEALQRDSHCGAGEQQCRNPYAD